MNLLLVSLGLGALKDVVAAGASIGFVPTAGEPYADPYFVKDDRNRLAKLGYKIRDVDITSVPLTEITEALKQIDALFVAGGNTFYLMQQIRSKGLLENFREFALSERPYIGASAGAAICGPSIQPIQQLDDVQAAPQLSTLAGLGVFNFVVLPHYGKAKYLDKYHSIMKEYADQFRLVPLRDDEALQVSTGPDRFELVPSALVLHDAK